MLLCHFEKFFFGLVKSVLLMGSQPTTCCRYGHDRNKLVAGRGATNTRSFSPPRCLPCRGGGAQYPRAIFGEARSTRTKELHGRRKENATLDVTVKQLGRACPFLQSTNGYLGFSICDSKAAREGLPSFPFIY